VGITLKEKRKVLILVENLPVPFDRRVWMEATTLVQGGYDVSIICPRGTYPRFHEVLDGISIYRYPLPSMDGMFGHFFEYGIALAMTFLLTLFVFLTKNFDVIQSANPPDIFFLIALLFKPFGKKFVFDHHDLMPEICDSRWSGWKRWILRTFSIWSESFTFRTADHVIATNESYKKIAMTRGKLPADRITVVRSAPRMNRFQAVDPDDQWRHQKKHLVAYLGVMGPNDGLEYLLRSIRQIVHEYCRDDIHFVLVGGGDLQPVIKQMSKAMKLDDFVTFTGRVPDEQMIQILSSADVCVAPDPKDPLNDVSTMNKIIEYMALGKPIVSFNLMESMISAGEAAVYAEANDTNEFADQILKLLDDPEKRRLMAKFGRERFETILAWEYQEKALLDLYQLLFCEQPAQLQMEPQGSQD
jgi:glycosyltransferase involved in cell wall biosynthesis